MNKKAIIVLFGVLLGLASSQTYYNNISGKVGNLDFELWKDTGNTQMTLLGGGSFKCSWSNINNSLFRIGQKLGCTKYWYEYNGIVLDYAVDYKPNGNSYLCVYGWFRQPLVEYYIVESWGSWRPPGGTSMGVTYVDDGAYDVYVTTRVNQPSIDGNTTFKQYWSVRTTKKTSGQIHVHHHFYNWQQDFGLQIGTVYEVSLNIEGYQSAGEATVTKNTLTFNTGD